MTPEEYERRCELFHRVRDLDASEAASILAAEADPALVADVRRMLAAHTEGEYVLGSQPASEEDLSGETIGRYRVIAKVGEGGMATVYRALDTRLNRAVALKLLAPSALDRPEARERFLREARAAAALEHPNICTMYDWDEIDGRAILAMAFLPGQTVASLLHSGPVDVDVAVDIARQTARGLAAAHANGVVHRDVKPGNLMLSPPAEGSRERQVKILDFGVAHVEQERTLSAPGLAVGSIAYMSPEQITGDEVDSRTDLWSLGVTLYEMLAGRRPFDGKTIQELGARTANADPKALSEYRSDLPAGLEGVVERLLAKKPERRYDSAEALVSALEGPGASGSTRPARRGRWAVGLAAAAALLLAALAVPRGEQSTISAELAPRLVTSYPGKEAEPVLSPDGAQIAFESTGETDGNHDIYVQPIGVFEPRRLTDSPATDFSPAWSPDGSEIAFLRQVGEEREIRVAPAEGGANRLIGRVPGHGLGLDWSPDGELLATAAQDSIWAVRYSAPEQPPIVYPAEGDSPASVRFDPQGRRIAYVTNTSQFVVLPVSGDRSAEVRLAHPEDRFGSIDRAFAWSSDGTRLIYHGALEGPFLALRIADSRLEELPVPSEMALTPHIRGDRLVYERVEWSRGVWALNLDSQTAELRPLIQSSRRDDSPRFSPDGGSIAFASDRSGSTEIRVADGDGRNPRKLTSTGFRNAGSPVWSPDGRFIAFDTVTGEDNQVDIYVVGVEGGPPRRLTYSPATDCLPTWSADGRWIYFSSFRTDSFDLWRLPAEGGDAERVTTSGAWESIATPDGRYLYYVESGGSHFIRRIELQTGEETTFPELGDAGRYRMWAPGRDGIYFVDPNTDRQSVRFFDFESGGIRQICNYRPIGIGPRGIDLSPDGRTLLLAQKDRDERDIMLVEGVR